MCGFAGSYFFNNNYNCRIYRDWTLLCSKLLEHRGPDAEGFFVDEKLSVTARRLRIHDLNSEADQPFEDKKKNYLLAFNGAIYNYKELRGELKQLGCKFETNSDTEVVMFALALWGEKAFYKFDGMFSIFFYDKIKRIIFISRDKLGIKPLYYFLDNDKIIFSSEIKPILAHPLITKAFNKELVAEFFAFQNIMPPNTLFKDIYVLEPGKFIKIDLSKKKNYSMQTYWQLSELILSENNTHEDVEATLSKALQNCWNADRSVGVQLSGGVDSSLITAISSRNLYKKNINTFSVIFNDNNIKYYLPRSEEKYIDLVSNQFNTNNNKYLFNENEIKNSLVESIWYHEQPLNGPSTCLYLLLAKEIKKKTTVIITGEGADDIFLGYFSNWNFTDTNSLYKQFTEMENLQYLFGKSDAFLATKGRNELINNKDMNSFSLLDKATFLTMKIYLHGLLARHDRMFMSNGIEGRLPFCSDLILKSRFGLPNNLIHNKKEGKIIIKKIASKYFKEAFVYRKKIGFSSPFGDWCSNKKYWRNFYDKLDIDFIDYVSDPTFFLNHKAMDEGKKKWSGQNLNMVFSYINIFLWYKIFFDNSNYTKKKSLEKVIEYFN